MPFVTSLGDAAPLDQPALLGDRSLSTPGSRSFVLLPLTVP